MDAVKKKGEFDDNVTETWHALRPNVGVGAVFRLRDDQVVPTSGSKKVHPYAIIGGTPPPQDSPRAAMSRLVQLSPRHSYKPDIHGPLPVTQDEADSFADGGAVFSQAGEPAQLERPGVFQLRQFTIQVALLAQVEFLGWLPRDVIDRLAFRMKQRVTSSPYPPGSR